MTELSTEIESQAERFFERYAYPEWLRRHSTLAGRVACALAASHAAAGTALDAGEVGLAGFLHDIGRSPLLARVPGSHNVLSARVVAAEGLPGLVELVRRHPVYAPLDPALAPRTIGEKIVNVADRRAGQVLMSVRDRVVDMGARHPAYAGEVPRALAAALALEAEVFRGLPFTADELEQALPR